MAKRRQCSTCGTFNVYSARECKDCGASFGSYHEGTARTPAMCAFDMMGKSCPCRGIVSHGLNGDGPWYCREHSEALQGLTPTVVGNALPLPIRSHGVREYWAAMIEHVWERAHRENREFDRKREAA